VDLDRNALAGRAAQQQLNLGREFLTRVLRDGKDTVGPDGRGRRLKVNLLRVAYKRDTRGRAEPAILVLQYQVRHPGLGVGHVGLRVARAG